MINTSPRMVSFDEKVCCALHLAFEENGSLIRDFLSGFVPTQKIELCGNILINTIRMGWIPQEEEKNVYREAAQMEIGRLEKEVFPEDLLNCGCQVKVHA